jgi:hypothetical protein
MFTVTGNGDISPLGAEGGQTIERTLTGTFLGVIAVIIVAATFITGNFRRSEPVSRHLLAAKAIVIGIVAFATGLAAASIVVPLGVRILRANGNDILPVTLLTELRVIVGTAALLSLTAILALALGAIFRRGGVAITAAIALIVLPYIVAVACTLPMGPWQWDLRLALSQWLLRLTPSAGFMIQQSIPAYPHVIGLYTPVVGYYPLTPWSGLAVLSGYAVLALGLASFLLRRKDT